MTGISANLCELLDAAAHMDPEGYRDWALERICGFLQIDSAEWVLSSAAREIAVETLAGHEFEYRDSPGMAGPTLQLRFRRDQTRSFSDDERCILQTLAAQACAAWRMSAQLRLLRPQPGSRCAMALVDSEGRVHAVQGNFHEALRASWPSWRSGALPRELCRSTSGERLQMGPWRWSVDADGELLRVSAEPLGLAAFLTSREEVVAAAVLECGSQKAAAARLNISSHTVRNTLVRVYSKLGVVNRIELALRFRPSIQRRAPAVRSPNSANGYLRSLDPPPAAL